MSTTTTPVATAAATAGPPARGRPRPATAMHDVLNVPGPLGDLDLLGGDIALSEVLHQEAPWSVDRVRSVGAIAGSSEIRELARLANTHPRPSAATTAWATASTPSTITPPTTS